MKAAVIFKDIFKINCTLIQKFLLISNEVGSAFYILKIQP
jgi:hypothetical protein